MKKIIKIILVILLIIAIILVVVWFRARRAAQQQGQPTPTFRQFLGLGSVAPKQQGTTPSTGLSSDFATPPTDTTTSTTGDVTSSGTTTSSQFTSGPISPTQNNIPAPVLTAPKGGKSPNGATVPGTNGNATVIPAPNNVSAPTVATAASQQCTDADVTIQFTADEISRLNALQNRFYAISSMLHTDADVQNEVANHDDFKAKADQITELYNYCVAKAPLITAPLYTTRVTTPFYRDASRDGVGYWWNKPNGVTFFDLSNDTQDPQNLMTSQAAIEQIFKLNLW